MSRQNRNKNHQCSNCGKKLKTKRGTLLHIQEVHAGNGEHINLHYRRGKQDPSMADLAVQARMDAYMGNPSDDLWLLGDGDLPEDWYDD